MIYEENGMEKGNNLNLLSRTQVKKNNKKARSKYSVEQKAE